MKTEMILQIVWQDNGHLATQKKYRQKKDGQKATRKKKHNLMKFGKKPTLPDYTN